MGSVKISLEGANKIVVTGDRAILKELGNIVPGTHLATKNTALRFKQDEIIYTFVLVEARKMGTVVLTEEVKAWAKAEGDKSKQLAKAKLREDADLKIKYRDRLRRYQRVDVSTMLGMRRLILGNEPGTGKTLEAIAYCDEIAASKVLVIASKSLLGSWQQQINQWSSDPRSIIAPVDTTYKKKEKTLQNLLSRSRFYIVNYDMLRDKTYSPLWTTNWDVIICDEAHRLKGRKTQQTQGVANLTSESLLLLTGTWITNKHEEVFQLLQLINPKVFTSYWQFVERFCETEANYFNQHAKNILGPKNMGAYKYMMHRYLIQRKKKDVLTELPEVIHKVVPIELTRYQQKHYKELLNELMTDFDGQDIIATPNTLSQYTALRQLVLSPQMIGGKNDSNKADALLDILENTDGQVVVFSSFRKYIQILEELLTSKGITHRSIHGEITGDDRTRAVEDFRAGKAKVMLGTIKAMSEGLNLQTASTLVFMDKSYVPADNDQAIARIDRLGQKNSPVVYHLIAEGTIEDRMEAILSKKQDIIDEATAIEMVIKELAKG